MALTFNKTENSKMHSNYISKLKVNERIIKAESETGDEIISFFLQHAHEGQSEKHQRWMGWNAHYLI